MSEAMTTAAIAGGAAVLGAMVGGFSSAAVEIVRSHTSRRGRDFERRLEALVRFHAATGHWIDWRAHMALYRPKWSDEDYESARDENNRRAREMLDSYSHVQLLVSDNTYKEVARIFEPVHRKVSSVLAGAVDERTGWTPNVRKVVVEFDVVRRDVMGILRRELQAAHH